MKISVVSYLNSKPFIRGIEKNPSPDWNVTLDIPSECARKLISGEAEVGLVPVAVLPLIKGHRIITPYCIGANGKVDSVKLYSHVPVEQITKVILDYQSRTSVALVKILARELWKINPEWTAGSAGFETMAEGTTAVVVIGDRTFSMNGSYTFEYDLSEAWQQLTGLPFVFAVWTLSGSLSVENATMLNEFENRFSAALNYGLTHMDEVIAENQQRYPDVNVRKYLTQSISYDLTAEKREAIRLFLHKLA
jgi:chorismate dehydratase